MQEFKYKFTELFNPLLEAMRSLGGSAKIREIEDRVAEVMSLSEDEISDIHRGNTTKFSYRLAWARTYLKQFGLMDNTFSGVWILTAKGRRISKVDPTEVIKVNRTFSKKNPVHQSEMNEEVEEAFDWQDELLTKIKTLSPADFEILCQRILRESGFEEVVVTGGTGDGGIDGMGIFKMGGLIGFRVYFQSKRYTENSVPSKDITRFKGTMVGRADKGLFITTSKFTKSAKEEANRDGSPPIDLVDGRDLVNIMKKLGMGVEVVNEEKINLNDDWFKSNFDN
ncbi:MAG: restriction endonuclease [Patescibacteria group bacterium]|nr:restriction endonuclease [Patescibacteria group bacterium]